MAREGLFTLDNRGLPVLDRRCDPFVPVVQKNTLFESATRKCCGCERIIILRPDRSAPRHYCRTCDSYECDDCTLQDKLRGYHVPFEKFADQYLEAALRGHPLPK